MLFFLHDSKRHLCGWSFVHGKTPWQTANVDAPEYVVNMDLSHSNNLFFANISKKGRLGSF